MVGVRYEYPTQCEIRIVGPESPLSDRTTNTPNVIAYTSSSSNTGGRGGQAITAVASFKD